MANSDKNILITPNTSAATGTLPTIRFTGADNTPITMRVLDNGTLSFEATAGQLFSIADGLTGSIFAVNDISGIPSIEVLDTGTVRLAQYTGNVGIGIASPTSKLHVSGTANFTSTMLVSGLITGKTNNGGTVAASNDTGSLSVRGDNSNAAVISFHRPNTYAINMGLDTDNAFKIGGWSMTSIRLTLDGSGNLTNTGTLTTGGALNLNYASPAITSNNASTASIFTSTVTGITLGSSSIRTTAYPADGTTSTAAAGEGYMGMPQVIVSSGGRTLAATDAGKHIYVTTNSSQTITIPANSAVAFPVGTTIVIVNANTISTSIAITTDTLRLANSTSTGTRTLASNGMCTLLKINTTEWIASGNGLS